MADTINYAILSFRRTLAVRTKYTVIGSNNYVDGLFTILGTDLAVIEAMLLKLDVSSVTSTKASDKIKDEAAFSFSIIAKVIGAIGTATGNTTFQEFSDYTLTRLRQNGVVNQLTDTAKIMEVLNDTNNQQALADAAIDSTLINKMQTLSGKLVQLTKVPQDIIDQHKNDKILLKDYVSALNDKIHNQLDPAMGIYQLLNKEIYLAYVAGRRVRHHHLKRRFKVLDPEATTGILEIMVFEKATLNPLPGVKVVIPGLNIIEDCDEDAETYNDLLKPGTYTGKLIFAGYKDLDFDVTIEAAKTTTIQLMMEVETIE